MTVERLYQLVTNFRRWAGGLAESREHINRWLNTFAPSLPTEERHELIELLAQETEAMIDFGQKLADSFVQGTQTVECALDTTRPRDQRLVGAGNCRRGATT